MLSDFDVRATVKKDARFGSYLLPTRLQLEVKRRGNRVP